MFNQSHTRTQSTQHHLIPTDNKSVLVLLIHFSLHEPPQLPVHTLNAPPVLSYPLVILLVQSLYALVSILEFQADVDVVLLGLFDGDILLVVLVVLVEVVDVGLHGFQEVLEDCVFFVELLGEVLLGFDEHQGILDEGLGLGGGLGRLEFLEGFEKFGVLEFLELELGLELEDVLVGVGARGEGVLEEFLDFYLFVGVAPDNPGSERSEGGDCHRVVGSRGDALSQFQSLYLLALWFEQ